MEFELCCFSAASAQDALSAVVIEGRECDVRDERDTADATTTTDIDAAPLLSRRPSSLRCVLPDRIELCQRQDIDGISPALTNVQKVLDQCCRIDDVSMSSTNDGQGINTPIPTAPAALLPMLSVMVRNAPRDNVLALSQRINHRPQENIEHQVEYDPVHYYQEPSHEDGDQMVDTLDPNGRLLLSGLPFLLLGGAAEVDQLAKYVDRVCALRSSSNVSHQSGVGVGGSGVTGLVFGALSLQLVLVVGDGKSEMKEGHRQDGGSTSLTDSVSQRCGEIPIDATFLRVPLKLGRQVADVLLHQQQPHHQGISLLEEEVVESCGVQHISTCVSIRTITVTTTSTATTSPSPRPSSAAYFRFDIDRGATETIRNVINTVNSAHINDQPIGSANTTAHRRPGILIQPIEFVFHRAVDVMFTQSTLQQQQRVGSVNSLQPSSSFFEWLVWLAGVVDRILTSGGPSKLLGSIPVTATSAPPPHSPSIVTTGLDQLLAVLHVLKGDSSYHRQRAPLKIMLAGGVNATTMPSILERLMMVSRRAGLDEDVQQATTPFGTIVALHGSLLSSDSASRGSVKIVKQLLVGTGA